MPVKDRVEISAFWGAYEKDVKTWTKTIREQSWMKRLWEKDPTLWKKEKKDQNEITNRLGWLTAAEDTREMLEDIQSFAGEIKSAGFEKVVLLGMGGSSLAPEVFQSVFGPKKGYPTLVVVDNTSPDKVKAVRDSLNLEKTLFVVSSKSGSTIELMSFFEYFFDEVKKSGIAEPGKHFIAITDPKSPLEGLAKKSGFRKIFSGYEDVGGRFSVLSPFGIVPATLIGVDTEKILESAMQMMDRTFYHVPMEENAAAALGVGMAVLAEAGRDKLTILSSKELESFGDWAEQLVAESTGKEEVGVVPVVREAWMNAGSYSRDRFFVALFLETADNAELQKLVEALQEKGHPTLSLYLKDNYALGGEFFRWEMATAIACALLKINAFDQPNVQSAKDQAKALLKKIEAGEGLPSMSDLAIEKASKFEVKENDYISILAFLPDTDVQKKEIFHLQVELAKKTGLPVTVGFGPRYLHSTGQLHKGGADNGLFVVISSVKGADVAVPGHSYRFQDLHRAQAIGDCLALKGADRRTVLVEVADASSANLKAASEKIISFFKAS